MESKTQQLLPSCIVFGSLTTWPLESELELVRDTLLTSNSHPGRTESIVNALCSLPQLWEELLSRHVGLARLPSGRDAADQLARWASSTDGKLPQGGQQPMLNRLSMPMTVLRHFTQYFRFIDQIPLAADTDGAATHSTLLDALRAPESGERRAAGIQGFCVGLLSALSIAGAHDQVTLANNMAFAVRLAFAAGIFVDLDALDEGQTTCLAIRWRAPMGLDDVEEILTMYDGAYISVLKDTHDASVTVPSASIGALKQELADRKVSAVDTGLSGRYHFSPLERAVEPIMEACSALGSTSFGMPRVPVRSNDDGKIMDDSNPATHVRVALRSILAARCKWTSVMMPVAEALRSLPGAFIQSFGADAVPLSVSREIKVVKAADMSAKSQQSRPEQPQYPAGAIAVVGMSCKFPGADSVDQFWQMLLDGRSCVEPVPPSRWTEEMSTRAGLNKDKKKDNSKKPQNWGNFIRDIDAFDHRFFKKSAREAASMDPQQRLLLEATYEAMASAGYFANPFRPHDVGVYIGMSSTDYDANVGSHQANAFSTLGTLRAFISGKLSHFFGWTSPSLTIDTACSSSAVAIHAACQAIRNGECSRAVAGGIVLLTAPYIQENLAAAHFLSPTGACKPFDARADGYCRGEGVGLVVLKDLVAAQRDGNEILAVLGATGVNQNRNCGAGSSAPIAVPVADSQRQLFEAVAARAGIIPSELSLVEAHGTGTPVGDPIEMESIRAVFGNGSPQHRRKKPVYVSSVKGAIGHLEGASGVAGLIRAILQIEKRTATLQASFRSLNPKIPALGPDNIVIPTQAVQFADTDFLTACVNNYGAAGSNAALIVMQAPKKPRRRTAPSSLQRQPILVTAHTTESLSTYCLTLADQLQAYSTTKEGVYNPSNIAYSLSRRQNQELPYTFITTSSDLKDLETQLRNNSAANQSKASDPRPTKAPPLVLAFGGQVRDHVNLDKEFYEQSALFRYHLDQCDVTLQSLGFVSGEEEQQTSLLYPGIFSLEPVSDIAALHAMVFSVQYATAKAWMDSGLVVDAVIGHSLGQLTALCVSGALSLVDSLRLVVGRAELMQSHWGSERGAMLAVEAAIDTIKQLLTDGDFGTLEVACYNGPRSHVLVGSAANVDIFQRHLTDKGVRAKRLAVTHGFHSRFTDTMIPPLEDLARGLGSMCTPQIRLETCSPGASWSEVTPELIAHHTREPVYFTQAVQRLAESFGEGCTWLEAGSDSGVAAMIRRVLDDSKGSTGHIFQPMVLSKKKESVPDVLADATVNLWRRGHQMRFWGFHPRQRDQYDFIRLPPYSFEKTRHWLDIIPPQPVIVQVPQLQAPAAEPVGETPSLPPRLITLQSRSEGGATFGVNPQCEEYTRFVGGHVVAGAPLCPATVYVELAVRAAREVLAPTSMPASFSVQDLKMESPLGLATDRRVTLRLRQLSAGSDWAFDVSSQPLQGQQASGDRVSVHAVGHVIIQESPEEQSAAGDELARFERLVSQEAVDALLHGTENDTAESVHGSMVYRLFSRVVEYDPLYKGIRNVAVATRGKTDTAAGTVTLSNGDAMYRANTYTLTLPSVVDAFIQLSGIHANIFDKGCAEGEVFVMTSLARLVFGPDFTLDGEKFKSRKTWKIWLTGTESQPSDKERAHDLFVYDATTGHIVVLILGARFTRVSLGSLSKVLSRVNINGKTTQRAPAPVPEEKRKQTMVELTPVVTTPQPVVAPPTTAVVRQAKPVTLDRNGAIFDAVCELVERVAEVPRDQVKGNVSLDEIGIDSLMLMEVFSEISAHFDIELPLTALENMADVDALVRYLIQQGASYGSDTGPGSSEDGDAFSSTPASSVEISPVAASVSSATSLEAKPTTTAALVNGLAALLQSHLELPSPPTLEANLADLGLDSLLCIELASDVQSEFGVELDVYQLDEKSTFADLVRLVDPEFTGVVFQKQQTQPTKSTEFIVSGTHKNALAADDVLSKVGGQLPQSEPLAPFSNAAQVYEDTRLGFDQFVDDQGFTAFWTNVYPHQATLVLAYVGQAFKELGVDLSAIPASRTIQPLAGVLSKHKHLLRQLHEILVDGGYLTKEGENHYTRSSKPFDLALPQTLLAEITRRFPLHAAEHRLLDVTGSRLAACMTGRAEPLQLLFANKANRTLLAEVYERGPLFHAATRFLATYLVRLFSNAKKPVHLLEVGAGTGGTTRYLVDQLSRAGVDFTYTFTDISGALVSQARTKFAAGPLDISERMRYATLDCEKSPPAELTGRYDVVISTNCVHATPDVSVAARNIRQLLQPDGFLALVEYTRNLFWFDVVFGLLDGWWLFVDGRDHALASTEFWDGALRQAGFPHVAFSGGDTEEANTLRVICAFNKGLSEASLQSAALPSAPPSVLNRRAGVTVETVAWKHIDGVELLADVYSPADQDVPGSKRPVALLLHGGGYVACTRRDIPMRHVKRLLALGFLPISIDYRLCPEVNLVNGALADAVDAIAWARGPLLPTLPQSGRHVDSEKLAVVGWSVGGHLGMTAAGSCAAAGVRPPDAVVAFYAPSNFEDDWWKHPIYPSCIPESPDSEIGYEKDLLEGVGDKCLPGYDPPSNRNRPGMFITLRDPRWRICAHMNWAAQMVPILVHGLPGARQLKFLANGDESNYPWARLPWPTPEQVRAISPRGLIDAGAYGNVPTFMVHGTLDDLIPAQQTAATMAALAARGVDSEAAIVEGIGHGFDLAPGADPRSEGWKAVERAYEFLCRHVMV
ncbi:uncharacterized protein E0L32_000820 [Thyridium curvatum]|uniref:Uncharacterized protein n=1 Tax=Thyridium curvatum TaxID=1093900 RepID=A0A507AYC6_9PEZI|nr:uncharacterized protein E0L32_000820 [Thyridium curvatum]TPX12643.1 hypothetical protein E0L32_000820 [Thyridium curvatum]